MKKIQAQVKIKKLGEKMITVIASDESLDRHGEVLPISSWDLTKFNQAPRMLVDHDHRVEKIVGKWKNVRIEDKELLMDAEFHDFTDLAIAVEQMVNEGFLNTVSVGFIPYGPTEDGGRERFELIETSWVTVPANANAQVTERMKSLEGVQVSEETKEKVEAFAGETEDKGFEVPEGMVLVAKEEFDTLNSVSEKHETLVKENENLKKVVASEGARRQKFLRDALREVAKTVSYALHKSKNS